MHFQCIRKTEINKSIAFKITVFNSFTDQWNQNKSEFFLLKLKTKQVKYYIWKCKSCY